MKFSTRTRYGLRFLVSLASCPPDRLVQLGDLAKEEGISQGYLEHIVRSLKPLGILRSTRGIGGGYALIGDPKEINLEQVFSHLEGELSPVLCLTTQYTCNRMQTCPTRHFWEQFDGHTREFLRKMTLHDLMNSCNTPID